MLEKKEICTDTKFLNLDRASDRLNMFDHGRNMSKTKACFTHPVSAAHKLQGHGITATAENVSGTHKLYCYITKLCYMCTSLQKFRHGKIFLMF